MNAQRSQMVVPDSLWILTNALLAKDQILRRNEENMDLKRRERMTRPQAITHRHTTMAS